MLPGADRTDHARVILLEMEPDLTFEPAHHERFFHKAAGTLEHQYPRDEFSQRGRLRQRPSPYHRHVLFE